MVTHGPTGVTYGVPRGVGPSVAGGAVGQEAAWVRKPAALRGGLRTAAAHTRPTAHPAMAVPSAFLVPVLLLLCGLGHCLAAAHSRPGKGAHGPKGEEAAVPHGWWGWVMSLPGNGGKGQDVGLRGLVSHWGVRQRHQDPTMHPRTPGTHTAPGNGAAGGTLFGVLAPSPALEHG